MKPLLALLALAAAPALGARPAPRLLLTAEDFARIARLAETAPWSASVRSAIIQAAGNWPSAQLARYGLDEWKLPPEGGQWTLWYVCPTHGVRLQFGGPGRNVCPIDNRNFTGRPFDQVVYAWRHTDNAEAARDNALAYRFTGKLEYARAAARILEAYAAAYAGYPIHDKDDKLNTKSGARVGAQTLDEAGWLIPIAWAYDLIADSGALDSTSRATIERDLLRAAAAVIARNNAGVSNWQSWHNSAIGAVGFALDDPALIASAIDGPDGFRFQMRESVLGDGAWYEGAWGYHFYALDPLCQLAEMAARAGIDLYADMPLRRMFEAPLRMAMPDFSLPPFNDSGAVNVAASYDRLYEIAWQRYNDPAFGAVPGRRARGREALFWGAASLPESQPSAPASAVFEESGNAVLRAGGDHYLALKFGPHGGWHGHYDKLGFISYARGGGMAVDPGTQSYAAPTHETWDKVTLAHNTVIVDEKTQAEATGELLAFAALPSVSAVRASAGPAYKQARLERTLILTPDYAVDLFDARSTDGAEHRFDWIYHNNGALSTALPLQPASGLPRTNGYQHLSGARAAATDAGWQVSFDMNDPAAAYGSAYTSPSTVAATYLYSREQSASGLFSGRLGYDFSKTQGYVVFQTPNLTGQPAEAPLAVSLMVYGDGSGHRLGIRLYDATDERFVFNVGNVNWTGWREIRAAEPAGWSHYLGNNDGVFDGPLKLVGVELTSTAGKPERGALYVDDIAVEHAWGRVTIADFERNLRGLRLWMAGAPETTVVTGNGLGPDLRKPVPFAMARRRGTETRFAALLEPYSDEPRVTAFTAAGTVAVTAAGFEDRVSFEGGVLRYVRRAGGKPVRLALAGAGQLEDGGQILIMLESAVPVEAELAEGALRLHFPEPAAGAVRVYAPGVFELFVNGAPATFAREGDYVVYAP